MRPSSQRIILWTLACLFGLLSLGDRGFHALTITAHADETGLDDPDRRLDEPGEDDSCAACRFFGQAQVVLEPPTMAQDSPAAPAPLQLGPHQADGPVEFVASSRGPPRRG
ncbi:hypothetical protein [Paludisphaera soli]|uniref:hypothetical protein n=1 Tax=Paludisphaera soli TaxID=2712865 RepID=UPI0013ECD714|nr:hypothetical protein [Paludisphaera soli]